MKKINFNSIVNLLCTVCIVGTTLLLMLIWNKIPEQIPGHYNMAGEVDRMTGKMSLIVLLVLNVLIYGIITFSEHFPEVWNTGVTVTEENRERVYRTLKYMIGSLKLEMVLFFCYLIIQSMTGKNLPIWSTGVSLAIVFGTLIGFLVHLIRIR